VTIAQIVAFAGVRGMGDIRVSPAFRGVGAPWVALRVRGWGDAAIRASDCGTG